jgi:hypothetical protein
MSTKNMEEMKRIKGGATRSVAGLISLASFGVKKI